MQTESAMPSCGFLWRLDGSKLIWGKFLAQ
jgi:hypothetical protein